MESRDYLRALRRFWQVMLACVVVGVIGAATYNYSMFLDEAKASVAVLSPLVSSKASGTTEAQVSFDAIVKSNTLASRVGDRMNESEQTIVDNLSVTIDTGAGSVSSSAITSPLYVVHGKDHGLDRAEKLVTIAVEEASLLYFKINATDGSDLKAAIATQRQIVAGEVTAAESARDKFATANHAVDLPNRIQQQRDEVAQLTLQTYSAEGDYRAATYQALYNRYASLNSRLTSAQAELDKLSSLLPTYDRLQFEVNAAQTREQEFDIQNQSLLINTLLPSQVQVKMLDTAAEENQILYLLLVYGLGAVSGIILGLASIYVLALVYKRPATAEEVAQALGAPILVRIPRVAG